MSTDLLFTGGRVLTMGALDRIVSGAAVRIVAAGDGNEVRRTVNPDGPAHRSARTRARARLLRSTQSLLDDHF